MARVICCGRSIRTTRAWPARGQLVGEPVRQRRPRARCERDPDRHVGLQVRTPRRAGRLRLLAAPSALVPWPVGELDICRRDDDGAVWEVPIYSERRWLELSAGRIRRAMTGRQHRSPQGPPGLRPGGERRAVRVASALGMLLRRHARKADFNQCSAGQLTGSLRRAFTRQAQDSGRRCPSCSSATRSCSPSRTRPASRPSACRSAPRALRLHPADRGDALPILRAA